MELNDPLPTQLKSLRLSGMLETLSSRHQQAIAGQWSYVEFLSRLLEDEVERRAQKQLALRLRRGTLNTTKTLEGFSFTFNPGINRQQVLALASGDYLRQRRNVLICGPSGVGKTQPGHYPYRHDVSARGDRAHHRSASSPLWTDAPTRRYYQPILSRTLLRHRHARRCRA